MGTQYRVKWVAGGSAVDPVRLQQQVDQKLVWINSIMSTYIDDSELSLVNQGPVNEWITVTAPLFEVLRLSQEISIQSSGAFDITVGPLVNRWGFGPDEIQQKLPSEQEIATLRERVGYRHLELDSGIDNFRLKKHADIYLDLSAIAKGYATDVLAELLFDQGIQNFLIEIGGELRLAGLNADGEDWRIGVEQPTLLHQGAVAAVQVTDAGVATSGDYRNYYEVDGVRFSHTINPATGRPITHALVSVTVIAASGALADAYATAINVKGPEQGYQFALEKQLAAYFIIRDGDAFGLKYTPQFEHYLKP